jgi:diguanylate cyclase (GGDEF)-like protein/PAS domain S-box-containing protein
VKPHYQFISKLALVTVAYVLTGKFGLMIPYVGSHITLIWLPTGVAVYALMMGGYRFLPAIFLGAFLVNFSVDSSVFLALSIAIGNTLGPLVTFLILKKAGLDISLNRIKDMMLILISTAFGMTISATCGVASLLYAGLISAANLLNAWLIWWAGDTVGILVLLPLLLTLTKKEIHQLWQKKFSFISLSVLSIFIEMAIIEYIPNVIAQFSLLAFLILPLVVLMAMRFGLTGSSFVVLMLSIVAIFATYNGQGPFYQPDMHQGIMTLWVYMCVMMLMSMMINILQSERLVFEKALLDSEAKLRAVIDGALDAIISIDNKGKIVEFNPAAERIFLYKREDVLGRSLAEVIIPPTFRSAHHKGHQRFIDTGEQKIFNQRIELTAMRSNGSEFPVELTLTSLKKEGLQLVTGFIRDITLRKNAEEEINQLAFYESLTGLPNRRLFLDRLGQALVHSEREKSYGAIMFLDLDHFKAINDSKGHDVGDKLLIEIAQRLKKQVRESDTISRLGGDEFVILLQNLSNNHYFALLAAREIAEALLKAISVSCHINGFELHSTSSIGISLFFGNEVSHDELLKRADAAMYQAKEKGRNTLCFYDPAMQLAVENQANVQSQLRAAIELDQLLLHFQVQVDLNRNVIGAEALLRWNKPADGLVLPCQFIAIAEESGLIVSIGAWVIETACKQLKCWESTKHANDIKLAVNVSARQFKQPTFVDDVKLILEKTGANPKLLKLELTESIVIDDVKIAAMKMQELKAIGVSFSMDDFGTGYSSLIYLKKLPLSQIKIDQSFVRDLVVDASDAEIVKTIVLMGQALGFNVIAEGVETEQQFDLLKEYGCKEFQGYLFNKSVNIDAFDAFIKDKRNM